MLDDEGAFKVVTGLVTKEYFGDVLFGYEGVYQMMPLFHVFSESFYDVTLTRRTDFKI